MTTQPESKLIILKSLANEIEDALKTDKKWVSVIDVEGNAEVYFKYQGTSVFSILEKEVAPENLCRSLLTMVKYPRTLTINYLDLPYENIFNETYFPENVLDVDWINKFENIEKLRQNFLQEFPEEIFPCPDFKMCFLFRKDNVPELLFKKTNVLEICAPSEIAELREKREEAREAREAATATAKVEEEKKVEEPKVEAKKPAIGVKSTSSAKTTGATAKTTAKVNVSTAPKTGVTSKTTSTPVKTTVTVTKSAGSGGKTTTVTANASAKTSTTTKVTTKK